MKRNRYLLVLLALALLLTACGPKAPAAPKEPEVVESPQETETDAPETGPEEPASGGVLVWNIGSEPGTWDPQLSSQIASFSIVYNVWDALVRDGENGIEPALAESWEVSANEEGVEDTVYTFTLRDGIKWNDGQPILAQEVVDSWIRAVDPEEATSYAFLFTDYVKGAEEFYSGEGTREDVKINAPDDKTIVIELKMPVPYFLSLVSFTTFCPTRSDVTAEEGWEKEAATCISSGAFNLKEYSMGQHILLEKNPEYWDAENVKLDQVKILMIGEPATALQGYVSGDIQILDTLPQEEIPRLMAEDPNFTSTPGMGSIFYTMNVDVEPTNDVNFRKALTYSIDRKALVEQVLRGGQEAASAYVPSSFSDSTGNSFRERDANGNPVSEYGISLDKADVELAKEYLAKAGYDENNPPPSFELFHDANENNAKLAQAIQEMWRANLGLEVELVSKEWKDFAGARYRGEFTVAHGGWYGDYNDPMTMFDLFTSQGINYSQWRWQPYSDRETDTTMNPMNKEYEEKLQAAMRTSGAERDQLLHEAEDILMEDAVVIPLYYSSDTYIIDEARVTGVTRTPMGWWDFRFAEMDE